MPTNIYTRLGDWPAVVNGNLRAADAALEHPAGERRQFVWDEFSHAIEYPVYAYLQQGNDAKALEQLHACQHTLARALVQDGLSPRIHPGSIRGIDRGTQVQRQPPVTRPVGNPPGTIFVVRTAAQRIAHGQIPV